MYMIRSVLTRSSLLAATFLAAPAAGQVPPSINTPDVRSPIDQNGVDLATGAFSVSQKALSIGGPGSQGLRFTQTWAGNGWRNNYSFTITDIVGGVAVNVGDRQFSFSIATGSIFTSKLGDGATL